MAIANFFEKNALAASHLLNEFAIDDFRAVLEANVIGVAFDEQADFAEGRVSLELAINLLARLYPRIAVRGSGGVNKNIARRCKTLARSINPDIEVLSNLKDATAVLVVGSAITDVDCPNVYLGSEGWIAKVSTRAPVGSGEGNNPFGAAAAACLGAANIFRLVFRDQFDTTGLDENLRLSLLTYDSEAGSPDALLPNEINLGEVHLAGVGAIGNAAVWTLARTSGLRGTLHLVDDETVELSNLQRYVLTRQKDVGAAKVQVGERSLSSVPLNVVPHRATWGEYMAERNDFYLERVAVALDSAEDRVAVQAALPRWIANAWTQLNNLGVSRHRFIDDFACLACLYIPTEEVKSESLRIAEEVGMPEGEMEIRKMLDLRTPVDRAFLARVAETNGIDVESLLRFEGQDLYAFYSQAVCGGVLLSLGGSSSSRQTVEAPMAPQSALAGIMLAAEIVVDAAGLAPTRPTRTDLNLLAQFPEHYNLNSVERKHPSGCCLCQDALYRQAYSMKYLDTGAAGGEQ